MPFLTGCNEHSMAAAVLDLTPGTNPSSFRSDVPLEDGSCCFVLCIILLGTRKHNFPLRLLRHEAKRNLISKSDARRPKRKTQEEVAAHDL